MQKWMRLAQRDLNGMRRAVDSLKLAKALEEPIAIMDARRPWAKIPEVLPAGVERSQFRIKSKDEQLKDCARIVAGIQKGKRFEPVVQERDVADLMDILAEDPPEFEFFEGEDAAETLKRISGTVSDWQRDKIEDVLKSRNEIERTLSSTFMLKSTGKRFKKVCMGRDEALRNATKATDALATVMLAEGLAEILDGGKVKGLAWVGHIGIENVRRYKNLDSASKSRGNSAERRIEAMRKKFELACPEALAKLRAQSEILKEGRGWEGEIPAEENWKASVPAQGNGRTEIEDLWRLRSEYPNLHRIMVSTPTEAELEARRVKKEARLAMREGVPPEFVRGCLRRGIEAAGDIVELYAASGKGAAPEPEAAAKEEWAQHELKNTWAKRVSSGKRKPGNGEAEGEKEGDGKRPITSKEDIIASIQLTPEARAHIRGAGLSPKDVINVMIRGFDMAHKEKAAVGGAHWRGNYIRQNIRRYIAAEYRGRNTEAPGVDKLLDYLKSIDVVQEFGSGATTRTKDDAMSINTNPGNAIGKGIVTGINAVLIGMRKN